MSTRSAHELCRQLRKEGIADERVLRAMREVPREAFVPPAYRDLAWEDEALPIAMAQTISQPFVVAAMTEALEVRPPHRVLEIGTGSGYQAAVLSKLCREVYTIERYQDLYLEATSRLRKLNIVNVSTRWGDGRKGWPEAAPFDRIIVTAAADEFPEALAAQLVEDGIMVIPLEEEDGETLVRLRRSPRGLVREALLPVRFVPLLSGTA